MKIVAYYRVSTKRQGESGLGLDAQKSAVAAYVKQHGAELIGEHTEVETGKRSDRPKLAEAIGQAKLAKAVLVVAKLDRLARNVAFLSALMESGIELAFCDYPTANRLMLHILAAVAEDEARAISDRTKAALGAAKARGVKLGSARPDHWKGREHLRGHRKAAVKAAVARTAKAVDAYQFLAVAVKAMHDAGQSYEAIASELNGQGHRTRKGAEFTPMTVWRVLKRAG